MNYEEAELYLDGNADYDIQEGEDAIEGYSDKNYDTAKGTDSEKFIRGLQILAKYDEDIPGHSEHDILYVAEYSDKTTKEEVEELCRLGFHLEEESWAKFT